VEVLHGNEPTSGHARRAGDGLSDAQRSLDWGSRPSDILLFPHSPLSVADVLANAAGRFDLLPVPPASSAAADELIRENALADKASAHAPVVSLHQRRRQRNPRERVNLLTRHGHDELLERCRELLVENALVKGPGIRQLFLVAGFLSWRSADGAAIRCRAPLLLYPVLLVRRHRERRYELRLDGSDPIDNDRLASIMLERHGLTLPRLMAGASLSDYLARVSSLLGETSAKPAADAGLEIDFDIALGNAELPRRPTREEPVRLPPFPTLFDAETALKLSGTLALDELQAVLHLLPDYASPQPSRGDAAPSSETPATEKPATADVQAVANGTSAGDMSLLREYAARLAAEGLDNIEFRHLGTLPSSLERWRTSALAGIATRTVETLVGTAPIGARHLVRLASIIELIDKAPAPIEHYAHPDLGYRSTTGVLRRARHQARLIEDELTALQDWFVLDKVPAKRQLLSLIEELGGSVGLEPDIVDADYFNARRQFMEFSIEKPANLTPEHQRLLGQLAKVLRFRELFVNNTEYRSALGPGYRGLRTDWEALESMCDYAQELADVLESETLAAAALEKWTVFRRAYVSDLELLQTAADGTRRLLRIGGSRWQPRPILELLNHTAALGTRLEQWAAEYGRIESHANRTPASLLARFSGSEREDLLTEVRVGEARTLIDGIIRDDPTRHTGVNCTLAWMRTSCELATTHELGIEAIVARLQLG